MVTIVLLKVACTWTVPLWTTRFSFFLKDFFFAVLAVLAVLTGFAVFAGVFAMIMSLPTPSSYSPQCRDAGPCGCARWCACAVRELASRAGVAFRGRSPFRCDA